MKKIKKYTIDLMVIEEIHKNNVYSQNWRIEVSDEITKFIPTLDIVCMYLHMYKKNTKSYNIEKDRSKNRVL